VDGEALLSNRRLRLDDISATMIVLETRTCRCVEVSHLLAWSLALVPD